MTLDEYQVAAHETAATQDIDVYMLGLIGEAGSAASAIKKFKRDAPSVDQLRADIGEELGDVLWYVSEVASRFDLSLSGIAERNLEKTKYLFDQNSIDFDDESPVGQRFPRKFEVVFSASGNISRIEVNGSQVGDSLTDNAHEEDGYRFHDVFHLSNMVFLGWSPVWRKFLNAKRRYNLQVDEVEDGARARFLEEGIAILVFSQSSASQFTDSDFCDGSNIPFWVLESIKKMTKGLEVSARSVKEWRAAISEGFKIFDLLRANEGGIVTCDLDAKTMAYAPLP